MNVARKFTLALVVGILLVHTGSGMVRVRREMNLFHRDIARDSKVLGRALAHSIERVWATNGERDAMSLLDHANDRESDVSIRWVWLDTPRQTEDDPLLSPAEVDVLLAGTPVVTRRDLDVETLYTYVPAVVPTGRPGAIEIIDPLADEHLYLQRSIRNAMIAAVVLVALCATLAWILGERLIGGPVSQLVEQACRVGRGDLSHRIAVRTRDEIGALGVAMNQMCDNLDRARGQVAAETRARMEAIDQLRHADRLKTIGTLASGVAHELGTPLNVIDGHAELIREDSTASEPVREHAVVISRQAKRITGIVRQLLDFARRGEASTATADVRQVARETLRMLEPFAKKRSVSTELVELTSDGLARIDAAELQQVLTNIGINGLQAMTAGGTLALRVERAQAKAPVGGAPERDYLRVRIEDTGTGMCAETAQRVFEPFFTTKDVGDGTGLGLSVAYGIIADRGGWIDVQSEPGRGSCFSVYVPAEEPTSAYVATRASLETQPTRADG